MYTPAHFEETRLTVLHDFVRRYPLASVVATTSGRIDANHLPLLLDPAVGPYGQLCGHVARANPMWQEIEAGSEVLVLFHGANGYISPSLYPSKKEHGRVVPTWNYGVVHARGRIAWVHDRQWLRAFVGKLTAQHEAGRPEPWQVSDAPGDYIGKMLEGIVGLEIPIMEIKGKMKLSQNRSEADRSGVRRGLSERVEPGAAEMVGLMDEGRN